MSGDDERDARSPGIERLRAEVASGATEAVERFWRGIRRQGSPLVEPLEGGRESLTTFLWRGSGELGNVVVLGPLVGLDAERNRLTHLEGSDVWYGTYRLPSDARGLYWLSPDDSLEPLSEENWGERTSTWRADPLNPEIYRDRWHLSESDVREVIVSVLVLPDALPQPWVARDAGVQAGTVAEHAIRSQLLGNERRVWVYTPAGYEQSAGELGVVVLLDGQSYAHSMDAPTVLDNLIAAGRIPPLIAIMPDSLGRRREVELPCYPAFADFLADELLPWARERYRIVRNPPRIIVGGASFGGLAAAYAALRRPEVFGGVLSQSGSVWWQPEGDEEYEWLARRFAEEPVSPIRFYLDVGRLETEPSPPVPSQILANRHLRTVLCSKGYDVSYQEFGGGHDEVCWRGTLADGLIALTQPLGEGR